MDTKESDVINYLRRENEEFRRLQEEHRRLEEALAEMEGRRYLTTEEEVERKKIQKQKLIKKDRMAEIIREYKERLINQQM